MKNIQFINNRLYSTNALNLIDKIVKKRRLLNIRTTLRLRQENFCARIVSEQSFYINKFCCKIITKDLIWKYSETATPWVFD